MKLMKILNERSETPGDKLYRISRILKEISEGRATLTKSEIIQKFNSAKKELNEIDINELVR